MPPICHANALHTHAGAYVPRDAAYAQGITCDSAWLAGNVCKGANRSHTGRKAQPMIKHPFEGIVSFYYIYLLYRYTAGIVRGVNTHIQRHY